MPVPVPVPSPLQPGSGAGWRRGKSTRTSEARTRDRVSHRRVPRRAQPRELGARLTAAAGSGCSRRWSPPGQHGASAATSRALEWLERQPAPAIHTGGCAARTAPVVFVPPNDQRSSSVADNYLKVMPEWRSRHARQPRRFPVAWPPIRDGDDLDGRAAWRLPEIVTGVRRPAPPYRRCFRGSFRVAQQPRQVDRSAPGATD